uniref:Nucleotidyltransferase domain-containing protein n=1 Tax=Thermofilum pendens TaxID=2269 RepID=A0A7C3WT71_THEPE
MADPDPLHSRSAPSRHSFPVAGGAQAQEDRRSWNLLRAPAPPPGVLRAAPGLRAGAPAPLGKLLARLRRVVLVGLRELAAERVGRVVREHSFIAGVVLFGSVARGEEGERSDVDLLVLWEGLDERKAARVVYEAVSKHFPPGVGLTVLESDYWRFVRASKATA